MGKTHEALERAENQYKEHQIRASQELFSKEVGSTQGRASVRKYLDRYGDLKNDLLARNSDGSIKSVLFIKTFKEGESTDHAAKFATSLAEDLRLKVLLVDLNLWTIGLQEVFKINYALGLSDLFSDSSKMLSQIKKVGPGNLYKVRWGGDHSGLADQFKSGEFDQFFKKMYERFDYLVLNAPKGASFQECRTLCSKVDAVALILKSGKIAGQIALNAKKHIENPADKLIGLVINNTRTYQHKFFKAASVVVAICLIFTFGFFLGNSRLKLRGTSFLPNYIGVIPNIKSDKPIRPEKFADLAQLKENAKAKVAGEQIQEFSKLVPLSKETNKEHPPTTVGTAPSTRTEFKAGQARGNAHKRKIESDSNKVDQQTRDFKKTGGLLVDKEIEKPILSQGNSPAEKSGASARQAQIVVVKKGETLFRIIYRTYGTYNDKIVSLVLSENPKIFSPTHIVAGQVIKLPEIN